MYISKSDMLILLFFSCALDLTSDGRKLNTGLHVCSCGECDGTSNPTKYLILVAPELTEIQYGASDPISCSPLSWVYMSVKVTACRYQVIHHIKTRGKEKAQQKGE